MNMVTIICFIVYKNIQSNYQCFSDWSKTEMSKFWAFNDKLHKMTWNELYKSASKGKDKGEWLIQ